MASTFQLLLNGSPADDQLITAISALEVEEHADLPGAIEFSVPVNVNDAKDLTHVSDDTFKPFTSISVVATPEGKTTECIFDGVVLQHKIHLETGTTASTLKVWGQDSSWLLNLEEKAREWVDLTDADVAAAIFQANGITPSPDNSTDDSPSHTEAGFTLMQRATDIQFLRSLARRNGKLCRVACADDPQQKIGYFVKPALDGDPVATFVLNDPQAWNVHALDIEWDVTRPSSVKARQALFNDDDPDGAVADTGDSGLAPLDKRALSTFSTSPIAAMLAAPVNDAGELKLRAQSLLREAGWFVRCEGEADVARIGAVLRVGTVVKIDGIGSLHSGNYYVWSVHHTITADSHKMKFVLVRNAVGLPPSGGGTSIPGL